MSLYLSLLCLECASSVLSAAKTYMFALVYLNGSFLHLTLSIYVLAVRKLQGGVDMGCVQRIKCGGIPGSAHWGTS